MAKLKTAIAVLRPKMPDAVPLWPAVPALVCGAARQLLYLMIEPKIRPATTDDLRALTECIRAAYAPYHTTISDLPDVTGGLAEDIEAGNVWVMDSSDSIVAGLVLSIAPPAAKLANIAVSPNAAGQGLGRQLIAHAQTQARARGCTKIDLTTHAEMHANRRLYEKLGWEFLSANGTSVHMTKDL